MKSDFNNLPTTPLILMKKRRVFTTIILVTSLLLHVGATQAAKKPSNEFIMTSPSLDTGVAKAYFSGSYTIVEFTDHPLYFSVKDDTGRSVNFRRKGKIATIGQRLDSFTASVDGKNVSFISFDAEAEKVRQINNVKTDELTISKETESATSQALPHPVLTETLQANPSMEAEKKEIQAVATVSAESSTPTSALDVIETVTFSEPAEYPVQTWEIRKTDGTLFGALSRWAHEANHQLIFDTDGNDFPTDTEASFSGTFETAIADVMQSLQYSKYPLRVCLWDNKPRPVVKVLHKNKRCED